MRLPRDLSGRDLAKRLERQYGYRVTRTREATCGRGYSGEACPFR